MAWNKSTLIAGIAVLVSVLSIAVSGIRESSAITESYGNRIGTLEISIDKIVPLVEMTPVIINRMTSIDETLNLMRNAYNRQARSSEELSSRTASLETATAVSNQVLSELSLSILSLTENTRTVTAMITKVEVIGERIRSIEENNRRSYKP